MTRKCCVPGCQTGHDSDKINRKPKGQKLSLFNAPKDAEMSSKWQALFPNIDKNCLSVCELHFKEDDIIKNYLTLMPDGTTQVLQRGKKKLISDAVPSINLQVQFKQEEIELEPEIARPSPEDDGVLLLQAEEGSLTIARGMCDYSLYVDGAKALRHQSSSHHDDAGSLTVARGMCGYNIAISETNTASEISIADKENAILSTFQDNNSDKSSLFHAESTPFSSSKDDFNFVSLTQNFHQVKLPQERWTINSTPKYVVCSKWDKDFKTDRRVVVDSNLNVKVFLKQREILNTADFNLKLSSFEDLSNVVRKVENYCICPGVDQPELAKNCMVYRSKVASRTMLCDGCQRAQTMASAKEKREKGSAERLKKVWSQRVEMWRHRARAAEYQNLKLTKKVTSLEKKIKNLQEKLQRSKHRLSLQNRLFTEFDVDI